mmetsp:Transcript_36622/g.87392  ORF Transcript_36622/g.87392 Transcript_36622/m.87392 type:complete len:159 (+) Transcript_36622:162-638(+)
MDGSSSTSTIHGSHVPGGEASGGGSGDEGMPAAVRRRGAAGAARPGDGEGLAVLTVRAVPTSSPGANAAERHRAHGAMTGITINRTTAIDRMALAQPRAGISDLMWQSQVGGDDGVRMTHYIGLPLLFYPRPTRDQAQCTNQVVPQDTSSPQHDLIII